jgi:hypothetical protein
VIARVWDMRVVWIERHRRWWWNAWRQSTRTELYGFANSRDAAMQDMSAAIDAATRPPFDLDLRDRA